MKKFIFKIIYTILRGQAKFIMWVKKPQVIAITGSIAKTTTKDKIFWILKDKFYVWKTPGNLNAEIGIPLTILGYSWEKIPPKFLLLFMPVWGIIIMFIRLITKYPKILVLEMGVEHKGDIEYFTKLAKPHISVITAIGPAHLKNFKNVEGVYREKSQLIKILSEKDWAVINKKDQFVEKLVSSTKANLRYFNAETEDISHFAALAVADIYEISESIAESRLESFKQPKSRLEIVKIGSVKIIDDSYNANPLSMKAAFAKFDNMEAKRKIAVLGDMLEQGDYSEKGHLEVGKLASKISDILIFVGNMGEIYQKGAKSENAKKEIIILKNADEAYEKIEEIKKPGDVILIKGSQGIGLQKVVEKMRKSK